jgi:hypothetical protein
MKAQRPGIVLGTLLVGAALLVAVTLLASGFLLTDQAAGQQPAGNQAYQPSLSSPGGMGVWSAYQRAGSQDPEVRKLIAAEVKAEQEVAALVAEYSKTEEDGDRAKVKSKLAAALAKQFDLQQKRRELELARVEAQLKKLRELMKKRADERKTIIDKRIDQLVREADGLGWAPPAGLSPPIVEPGVLPPLAK